MVDWANWFLFILIFWPYTSLFSEQNVRMLCCIVISVPMWWKLLVMISYLAKKMILIVKQWRMRRMLCWKWWPRRFGRTPVLYWPVLAASAGERRTDNYKLQGGQGSNLFLLCLPTAPRRQTLSLYASLHLPLCTTILQWHLFTKHIPQCQGSSNLCTGQNCLLNKYSTFSCNGVR